MITIKAANILPSALGVSRSALNTTPVNIIQLYIKAVGSCTSPLNSQSWFFPSVKHEQKQLAINRAVIRIS